MRTLDHILNFYAPFVSTQLPRRFQELEVLFPIVAAALLAIVPSVPLFVSGRWGYALFVIILWFIALYTLHTWMMHSGAMRQPDGTLYISPSVQSVVEMSSFFAQIAVTLIAATLLAVWFIPR